MQNCHAGGTLRAGPLRKVGHAWLVATLNPKRLTFLVAFLSQVLDPAGDIWTQILVFPATFLVLAVASACSYGILAARVGRVVPSPQAIRAFNHTGGTILVGPGVWTASRTA